MEKPHWQVSALALAAAVLLGFSAPDASALALGRVTVQSALGEPLRAEIEVPEINAEELSSLRTAVASPDAFRAAGLEYNAALSSVRITLERRADGRHFLRLTSHRAVTEPFLDVILETSWSSGRIVRDYTMLFDPPNLRQSAPPLAAQVSPAPSRQRPSSPPPAPAAASPGGRTAPPASTRQAQAAQPASDGKQVTVQAGDTAGKIAAANKPASVSLDQMLVALLQANPQAFVGGNVNRLRAGAVLDVPSGEQAALLSQGDARQTLVAQSRDFNEFRRRLAEGLPATAVGAADRQASGRLQAEVEDKKAGAATPDKLTLSKGAVQGKAAEDRIARDRASQDAALRVAELNKNISELNRLSSTTAPASTGSTTAQASTGSTTAQASTGSASAAKAGVAVPLGGASVAKPTAALPAVNASAARTATPPAPVMASAAPVASPAAASVASPVSAASAPVATAAAASAPTSSTAAAPSGAASSVAQPAAAAASGDPAASSTAVTPLAAPAQPAASAAKARPAPPPPPAPSFLDDLLENPIVPAGIAGVLALLLGFGLYRAQQRRKSTQVDSSFLESRLQPDSFFGASGGQRIDTNEGGATGSSMVYSPSQLDAAGDVDPVAEADVYLAYGRDLQAEEILKEAMRTTPQRVAIHSKLLEIYAKRRDAKAFELVAADAFGITRGEGPDWEHICELGKELDPSNALYRPGGHPTGSVAAPAAVAAGAAAFGAPSTQPMPVAELPASDLDLDLDFSLGDDAPAPMRDAFQVEPTVGLNAPAVPEAPPHLDMNFDSPSTLDRDARAGVAPAAPVAAAPAPDVGMIEFDLGALSLDLDSTPAAPAPAKVDEETDDAPLSTAGSPLISAGGFDDDASGDPLATKLALAQEFNAIGDPDGARSLAQEVVAEASGDLKSQAQRFLAEIS